MVDEHAQPQDPLGRVAAAPPEPTSAQRALSGQRTVRPPMADLSVDPSGSPAAPDAPVAGSYRTQSYRFTLGGAALRLMPGSGAPAGSLPGGAAPPSPPGRFHLLSGWSPLGAATTLRACEQAHARLVDALVRGGRAPVPAVTVAGDRTWFERSVLVEGLTDAAAVQVAVQSGQPAVVRWQDAALTVLPTGLRDEVAAEEVPCRLALAGAAGCPVRQDEDPYGRCVGYGGPWTGSARNAAVLWAAHRGLAVELLGCSSCLDGREPAWGRWPGEARLAPHLVPSSRYGGCGRPR